MTMIGSGSGSKTAVRVALPLRLRVIVGLVSPVSCHWTKRKPAAGAASSVSGSVRYYGPVNG